MLILVPSPDALGEPVDIRIPSLAAVLLNKANTFNLRGGPDGELKSAKDLVYIRDVMAAGERAEAIVQGELETLIRGGEADRVRSLVRRAEYHLRNVAERYLPSRGRAPDRTRHAAPRRASRSRRPLGRPCCAPPGCVPKTDLNGGGDGFAWSGRARSDSYRLPDRQARLCPGAPDGRGGAAWR